MVRSAITGADDVRKWLGNSEHYSGGHGGLFWFDGSLGVVCKR